MTTFNVRFRCQYKAFTLVELLVVIAIIGVLVALLLPAVQAARESSRRAQCVNNLKQLALSFHNFEGSQKQFPLAIANTTVAGTNNWAPYILPHIEGGNIADNYDLKTDWWKSPNRELAALQLKIFACPSTPFQNRVQDKPETTPPNKTGACGDYFTPTGVHVDINLSLSSTEQIPTSGDLRGVIAPYSTKNLQNLLGDILDGTSNTILLGECAGREDVYRRTKRYPVNYLGPKIRARGGAWATTDNAYDIGQRKPWDTSFGTIPGVPKINNSNEWGHCFYSFHPGGANFAYADGSVRHLGENTSLFLLAQYVTRAGGEATEGL